MFCFQACPDPMRRVPLLSRRFQIDFQYLLDLIFDRAESPAALSLAFFALAEIAALIACRTIRR